MTCLAAGVQEGYGQRSGEMIVANEIDLQNLLKGGHNMFLDTLALGNDEIFLRLYRTAKADPQRGYVPAYYFYICKTDDQTEIGCCDLRIGHNENTYYGGNIGYEIYKPYRGHHYAAKACQLLFDLARKHEMGYLIITCSPTNIASRKTCENAGCRLKEVAQLPPHNEMYRAGETEKCIYVIDLD